MTTQATFETADYGKIEVTRNNGHSSTGTAYFHSEDYVADVDSDGLFRSIWGIQFRIFWPVQCFRDSTHASLDVIRPKEIGRVKVQ